MTPEQLAALKEVAEKVADPDLVWGTPESVKAQDAFRSAFTPTTCLALLEEVERLTREVADLRKGLATQRASADPGWVY
jgi:hypothetical protein